MAVTGWPELDCGNPSLQESDRVRGPVPTDRERLPSIARAADSRSPTTNGSVLDTHAGGRSKARSRVTPSIAATSALIASGSCPGRNRMSTDIRQESGTRFGASPALILPRLIEGRSKMSLLARANGSDSIARNTSTARSAALCPSHGVAP